MGLENTLVPWRFFTTLVHFICIMLILSNHEDSATNASQRLKYVSSCFISSLITTNMNMAEYGMKQQLVIRSLDQHRFHCRRIHRVIWRIHSISSYKQSNLYRLSCTRQCVDCHVYRADVASLVILVCVVDQQSHPRQSGDD